MSEVQQSSAVDVAKEMDDRQYAVTGQVLAEVMLERLAQHRQWGEQNPPNGTHSTPVARLERDQARGRCETAFDHARGTWRHILTEEVMEAYAEDDPAALRAELIQVAAVAVSWIEAIDRQE